MFDLIQSMQGPLVGGVLIACASIALMLFLGRIAGISGILFSALQGVLPTQVKPDLGQGWRWFFLLGLILGPLIVHFIFKQNIPEESNANWLTIAMAGLLVGFGTKLGSGCTSGHGVCGIARLSLRSIVATIIFMMAGFVVVYIAKHLM